MFCRYCGKIIGDNDQFCQYCGREQNHLGSSESLKKRLKLTELKTPKETKNPGVAASMGFLLGWIFLGPVGYIYLEQWNWFWLTFIVQLFAIPLTFGSAYIVLPVVFAFHQYQMAKEINGNIIAGRDGKNADTDEAGIVNEDSNSKEEGV
ncbi:zinc ribbon domain-containing protein [bacterium]|nr:zinc ribbon domain-containing protein [bacterium]